MAWAWSMRRSIAIGRRPWRSRSCSASDADGDRAHQERVPRAGGRRPSEPGPPLRADRRGRRLVLHDGADRRRRFSALRARPPVVDARDATTERSHDRAPLDAHRRARPAVRSGAVEPVAEAEPGQDVVLDYDALRAHAAAARGRRGRAARRRQAAPRPQAVERAGHADGRVVLLDFGLVTERCDARARQTKTAVGGTPAYMAPEQVARQPLGPASDWYAVGVMLYEALTGRAAVQRRLDSMLMHKQQRRAAAADRARRRGVPRDLDALCIELLRRDPEARPSRAEMLAPARRRRGASRAVAAGDTLVAPARRPFIGRERAARAARARFAQPPSAARPCACSCAAQSGMGKSALVRRFLDELQRRDDAGRLHRPLLRAGVGAVQGARQPHRRAGALPRARLPPLEAKALHAARRRGAGAPLPGAAGDGGS